MGEHVLVIAEVRISHNGPISLAKELADRAKYAGADMVKFQTFNPKKLASWHAQMAEYQKKNMGGGFSRDVM